MEQDSAELEVNGERSFYLFSSSTPPSPLRSGSVFYRASCEQSAKALCRLFQKEYGSDGVGPYFSAQSADEIELDDQILLDEALGWLEVYDDPDPGIYDPPPTLEMITLAQYAKRASTWESMLVPRKGDRPQPRDDQFARMAIDEARKSVAEDTSVHPMVGCVVVRDGKVLATAHRGELKGNHAEFVALEIKLKDEALTGCTVYTTLEPCTTRNHPKIPCASRLIERKVARVVIGTLDPNPEIRGKGIWKIQQANIAIEMFPHRLAMELNELNRNFFRSFDESGPAAGQAQKEKGRLVVEKRKLYNLLRKINCIECDFCFPPGPTDAIFNGSLIRQINLDIESIRDALVELLDLPEARALADVRIPTAPLNGASWQWLEATWKEHFLPVQQLFRNLKAEVLGK